MYFCIFSYRLRAAWQRCYKRLQTSACWCVDRALAWREFVVLPTCASVLLELPGEVLRWRYRLLLKGYQVRSLILFFPLSLMHNRA